METLVLKVEGMTCGHCEKSVSGELKKVAGVRDAVASAQAGTATVTYDPALARLDDFRAAVSEAGYSMVGTTEAASPGSATHAHNHGHGGGHGGCGCGH